MLTTPHVEFRDLPDGLGYIAGRFDDGLMFLILSTSASADAVRRGWSALREVRRNAALAA